MIKKIIMGILFFGIFWNGLWSNELITEETAMTINYKNKPDTFWKAVLPTEVYSICRQKGTETPGFGKYNHFWEKGTYYCACCGGDHALYSSEAKFDSGTGWPSFWAPISPQSVILRDDRSGVLGAVAPRTEVICSRCEGHLGHVFDDGPKEHTGKRYCMNSPALTFLPQGQKPIHKLEKDGQPTG
jgi:peptide-methionine (R)-S-oxide reductase